jgi:hypothetical protein
MKILRKAYLLLELHPKMLPSKMYRKLDKRGLFKSHYFQTKGKMKKHQSKYFLKFNLLL